MFYSNHQHSVRQDALAKAIQVQEAPVGPPTPNQNFNFPTQDAKDQLAEKTFSEVASKYSGSDEGEIAQYYLACIKADQGKLAEAEKGFKEVADHASKNYASLAKFSLAQIDFASGRPDQGEALMRDLIANPTIYVSKEQAVISLAGFIAKSKPAEARKLLDPLRSVPGPIGQTALQKLGELPPG
jgi:hypothetical protein